MQSSSHGETKSTTRPGYILSSGYKQTNKTNSRGGGISNVSEGKNKWIHKGMCMSGWHKSTRDD